MKRFSSQELCNIIASPLGKRIDQSIVEKWSASFWELSKQDSNVSSKNESGHGQYKQEPFVMMLPPPNITGNLHLGHALTVAIQDTLLRHRKMSGHKTLWIPGFDHAGIATQNIVEKLLWSKHQVTRHEYGREKFIEMAHQWKDLKRNEMKEQINRLGLSLDYEFEYFTLDRKSSQSVHEAFKQLFENKLIYRSVRPVFWSEEMQTTLSDIEVEKDLDGKDRFFRTGEVVRRKELNQWFVDTRKMTERALEAVEKNHIEMIPPSHKNRWSNWLLGENLGGKQDWCISRQNWWGHRIPAYKLSGSNDEKDNWVVADNIEEASGKLSSSDRNPNPTIEVIQDQDVLDTWFSSSLLPLTISGWPNKQELHRRKELGLFPLTIMETGFDILNFWVSKMVMMSLTLTNEIPFKLVLLHGMICDRSGKKMSKTKGNVIDPLDVIDGATLESLQERTRDANRNGIIEDSQLDYVLEQQKNLFPRGIPACGADGLRAYLLSQNFQEEIVKVKITFLDEVRRLSNKIWNIFRFVLPMFEEAIAKNLIQIDSRDIDPVFSEQDKKLFDSHDRDILGEIAICVELSKELTGGYQLQHCFNSLSTIWTEHISNKYLIENKQILSFSELENETRKLKFKILLKILVTSTKLLHPYMPHQSEFLYQKLKLSLTSENSKTELPSNSLSNESFPKLEDWLEYLPTDQKKTID